MIIVGKKRFLRKDKSSYCHVLTCLVDFSDNQKAAGCIGMSATDVFVEEKFFEQVTPDYFNRECEFVYGMNSFGRPEPISIVFAEEK